MILAKVFDDGTVDLRNCEPEQGEKMTILREAGFLECVISERPIVTPGKVAVDTFNVIDGKLVQTWEIKPETTE